MSADDGVDGRGRYADAPTHVPHPPLAVDGGITVARVEIEDALGIAPVHPQDAELG
jgi:hypothetical protein